MGDNNSKDPPANNDQYNSAESYLPHPNQFQPGFTQRGTYTPPHPVSPFRYDHPSPSISIADNYHTLEEVTEALEKAGLESSNLIVGIDFTKTNEWTGKISFNKKSLHHIGDQLNPYEQAISIIGKTLSKFDEDNLIPCFGFGDASTHDQDVFSFYDDNRYCQGFEEVLSRYREIVQHIKLSGPTSFAPIIQMAMTIVEQSGGQYHVLLIIADGQVTRSDNTVSGCHSPQEKKSLDAIVQASRYPLSIVLVGVGDGPWDTMKEFDDNVPSRKFDNFQFVNFTEIMSKNADVSRKQAEFALYALMEIPIQYKATLEHGLLGCETGCCQVKVPLPPPHCNNIASPSRTRSYSRSSSSQHSTSSRDTGSMTTSATPTPSTESVSTCDGQRCPICTTHPKDLVFECGHQACSDCGESLDTCPMCSHVIRFKIKLR